MDDGVTNPCRAARRDAVRTQAQRIWRAATSYSRGNLMQS
jgi:hypothetical protein